MHNALLHSYFAAVFRILQTFVVAGIQTSSGYLKQQMFKLRIRHYYMYHPFFF